MPFTRDDWNKIIQDINDLATNPDEGCDPLETIEEVSESHIWAKEDVLEVQNKLIEICPDNIFVDLEDIWLTSTIDEIETAIDLGWCGCVPTIEWTQAIITVGVEYLTDVLSQSTGTTTTVSPIWPFTICIETRIAEYVAYGAWFNGLFNDLNYAAYYLGIEIEENIDSWIENRKEELLKQREVEDFADELRPKREELIILENQLAACQSVEGDCSSIEEAITEVKEKISELEGKIEIAKAERNEAKNSAIEYLEVVDELAEQSWEAGMAVTHILPGYLNIWAGMGYDVLDWKFAWGLGSYPYESHKQSVCYFKQIITPASDPGLRWVFGVSPIYFTPSGKPYVRAATGLAGGLECIRYWHIICTDIFGYESEREETLRTSISNGWRNGDVIEVIGKRTKGSRPVAEYNPDPDQ